MKLAKSCSALPLRRRLVISAYLCFAAFIIFMAMAGEYSSKAYAESKVFNPLVTVAVDQTQPSCVVSWVASSSVTHQRLWEKQKTCPVGTSIGVKNVSLSQAKEEKEPYVAYPSAKASSEEIGEWHQKIVQLMKAKRKEIYTTPTKLSAITPNYTCGYDITGGFYDYYYGTGMWFHVYYHVSIDCSTIVLNREEITGDVPVVTAAYWTEIAYSYYRVTCPARPSGYIGSLDVNSYPGVSEAIGLDNIWTVGAANPCFEGNSSPDQQYSMQLTQ